MLAGEQKPSEAFSANYSGKYDSVLVELFKGGLEVAERVFGNDVTAGDVTELEKCSKCPDDARINEPLDCVQVYLRLGD